LPACAVKAARVVVKPEGREGERPREAKPKRARVSQAENICKRRPQPAKG
jgi:hypothetical protein